MRALSFFAVGLLFAFGLGLSGMTQPAKVVGFLDLFGRWDPTLAFVMGGAVMVTFAGYRWVLKRSAPLLDTRFDLPTRRDIDWQLVVGATLFGSGWGMAGFCPGPALVALAGGSVDVMIFVAAMFVGFLAKDFVVRPSSPPAAAARA
ncbi:MAG: YeeE/YedE family protein [Gammaproteobacteria bacterium]|nr:YeeE/YedE family protein [Gammaproteobacteria bacterium]